MYQNLWDWNAKTSVGYLSTEQLHASIQCNVLASRIMINDHGMTVWCSHYKSSSVCLFDDDDDAKDYHGNPATSLCRSRSTPWKARTAFTVDCLQAEDKVTAHFDLIYWKNAVSWLVAYYMFQPSLCGGRVREYFIHTSYTYYSFQNGHFNGNIFGKKWIVKKNITVQW